MNRDPASLPGFSHDDASLNEPTASPFIDRDESHFRPRPSEQLVLLAPGYVDGFNLYGYVGQNPITHIDPSGLDRVTHVSFPFHAWIVVDVYDENCKKIGRRQLHFWPGEGGQYVILPEDSWTLPSVHTTYYKSSCCADRALLNLWKELEKDRLENSWLSYSLVPNNCFVPWLMFYDYDGGCPGSVREPDPPLPSTAPPTWPKSRFPCFHGSTIVWSVDGPASIESIRAGDMVLAYDFATNQAVYTQVLEVEIHDNDDFQLNTLMVNSAEQILVTDGHPMFDGKKWLLSHKVSSNSFISMTEDSPVTVTLLQESRKKVTHRVYNLLTENGNYLVGRSKLVASGTVQQIRSGRCTILP